jgi:hypothetical protein
MIRQAALSSLLLALTATAIAAPGEPSSRDVERLLGEVQICASSNASAVERAFESLNDAADFLVLRLCAEPLAAFMTERNKAQAARMQDMLKRACEAAPAGDTAETKNCSEDAIDLDFAGGWTMYASTSTQIPPEIAASAARTLLEFRTKRLDSAPQ